MAEPKKTSLQHQWDDYRTAVVPKGAPQTQTTETRRAFYAGAWAVLSLLTRVGDTDVPEEDGAAYIESLLAECRKFQRMIGKGGY